MGNTTVERRVGPWGWLFHLDRILRGEATQPAAIRKADIQIPLFGIAFLVFALGVIYGLCMSVFAVVNGFENEAYQKAMMQTVATMCKVPLLFLLTLVVTFPSLYVFNALSLIHISEPTRLLSISYAVFCLKKKIVLKNVSTAALS